MSDELILVDLNDTVLGSGEKMWVHQSDKLHRAFSVFIISNNKILLQRRCRNKYHSGGLWANACCSHPRYGERLEEAVHRRLREELGMDSPVQEIFHFVYRSVYENGLTEYEYDHVFITDYSGSFNPSKEEIEELKWITIAELCDDLVSNPQDYASWFLIAFPKVLEKLEKLKNDQ